MELQAATHSRVILGALGRIEFGEVAANNALLHDLWRDGALRFFRGAIGAVVVSLVIAATSLITNKPPEPALAVRDFSVEMGHLGFHLAAALTLLRRDEVGEMFPETDGADRQRVGQQEPAALLFLHEDNELVMEVAATSHEAPPVQP
jgi:hypothetical protein